MTKQREAAHWAKPKRLQSQRYMPPESNAELVDSVPAAPATPSEPATPPAAPDKPAEPAAPAPEATPEATPETPAETLYELPDGRKVDAATLAKEYKENLLPEFTRRSQRLAEYEKVGKPEIINKNEPKWKDPNYVPQSYAEVIEIAKEEAKAALLADAKAQHDKEAAIAAQVDEQIKALKATDPNLDENALFLHANKYGYTDLKAAYANMSDMKKIAMDTEQRVLKNIKTRDADPVAGGAGGQPTADDGYDPASNSMFSSAVEFFQARIKK